MKKFNIVSDLNSWQHSFSGGVFFGIINLDSYILLFVCTYTGTRKGGGGKG